MRGVVFKFCLDASAVEVEIDTHGAMYERRPIAGAMHKSRRVHNFQEYEQIQKYVLGF